MKVSLERDYRKFYTLEDLDAAKVVIACQKTDEASLQVIAWDVVAAVAGKYGDGPEKVLEVTAETGRNKRVQYDTYGEGSGHFDVYIHATAETYDGFMKVSFFLSDYWYMDSPEYIRCRCYHQYYTLHNGG